MRLDRIVVPAARATLALLAVVLFAAGCGTTKQVVGTPLPPLSQVILLPATDTLALGDSRQFVAAAFDTDSVAVTNATFDWTSTDPNVCTVTSTGLVTAVGEGLTNIIAAAGGQADTATVLVLTQPGWFAQTSGTAHNLNGVAFAPDGRTGVAVGDVGTIVRTTDAGSTWGPVTSGTSFDLLAAAYSTPNLAWAVGGNGTMLFSGNGGASWSVVSGLNTSSALRGITFADAAHGWAVGSGGAVLHTSDGGATWVRTNPTAIQLNAVAFSDTSNGWIVAETGAILGTHNGGAAWYLVQPSVTAQPLRAAARSSNTAAWAVGAAGVAPRTVATADSLQWVLGNAGASNSLTGVRFPSLLTGFAVGANGGQGVVLRTDDSGVSWTPQVSNSNQPLNAVWFADVNRGWAVGNSGRIVHTTHGGN